MHQKLVTRQQLMDCQDKMMEKYKQNSAESIELTEQMMEGCGDSYALTLKATRMAARAVGNLEAIKIVQEMITEALSLEDLNG